VDLPGGWDSSATLVDGRWVDRRPRRPEVAGQLRREARLMPWLAPGLPLPVPVPWVVSEAPLVVRHEFVPGEPLAEPTAAHGRQLGIFLRALHDRPLGEAMDHGLPPAERGQDIDDFLARVVPLVPVAHRESALALLDAVRRAPADTVVHGDLGPEHVLTGGDTLTGVIDFGDAHAGDAAIDLAWALHGTPPAFAEALAAVYGVTGEQRDRALGWHRLGPWYEVTHGLDTGDPDSVRTGLAGLLSRLPND
jgi:aminoglycoside phosphotransferase (APT) family kinase protein